MKAARRRRQTIAPDLGEEPPLVVGLDRSDQFTRREVSLRWLTGTIVTGLTSMALMGGALYAALEGRYVVDANAAVDAAAIGPIQPDRRAARKGDRVALVEEAVSNRRIIEVSTVTKQGEQDIIRAKPYALVTVSLVQDRDRIDPDIPAFDPAKLFEETGTAPQPAATDAVYGKQVDGEMMVSVTPFPREGVRFDPAAGLTDDEVEAAVREQQWFAGIEALRPVRLAHALPARTDAAGGDVFDPEATIRIVPENVSELVKSDEEAEVEDTSNVLLEVVQPNDTLSKILLGSGVRAADMRGIDRVLRAGWNFDTLVPGQLLRIVFDWKGEGEERLRRPVRLDVYDPNRHLASVALSDEGTFVAAEAPAGPPPRVEEPRPARTAGGPRPTIFKSLHQTAQENDVPPAVVDVIVRTFGFDVDFNSRVRPGDRLQVLYALPDGEADGQAAPEILFSALQAGGTTRRFYRYKSLDGGVAYYDETGRSPRKFLLRKPMARGVFRSGFGMRRHPILRYRKMHTGVDWAAPRGTPIYAAGDGTVLQAGWKAGYGRWTLIQHANGYRSGYAHQSRIAAGVKKGAKVTQGQVIGYVGTTGLSTGPHLHYEVHVNSRPVNPLKIRLPRGQELSGVGLERFLAERERIDALIEEGQAGRALAANR